MHTVQFDLFDLSPSLPNTPSPLPSCKQLLGQVQPLGQESGELFGAVLSWGQGVGQSTSLRFCEVCVILCAVCTMAADLKTTYFQGQN